jgi:hypothetical protein
VRRRAITIVEVLIAAVLLVMIGGVLISAFGVLDRQSRTASDALWQTQEALELLDSIRTELGSMVLNPLPDPARHHGNAFIISQPNGTSIQFVTERRNGAGRERRLVYYEARTAPAGAPGALALRKMSWRFDQPQAWTDPIVFPPGWPAGWLGPLAEMEERRWKGLAVEDMRWQHIVPRSGRELFVRVKIVLRTETGRLLPFTTLVGVPIPDARSASRERERALAPVRRRRLLFPVTGGAS